MPLVRGEAGSRPLLAVEADRVAALAVEPEALQPGLHALGLLAQPCGPRAVAVQLEQPRHHALGAGHVALHLDQRDRRCERLTRRVGDAVDRVLPALGHQSVLRPPLVFHETVAVQVPVPVDPRERGLGRLAQLVEEVQVARPVRVAAEQAQEQRRGVDAAVVAREGRLAERRRLAHAQLVEHLARLLVALVVHLRAEPARQQPQRALGHAGHEGERLEGRDQAVAAEQRREPGQSRRVVRLAVELRSQQLEVVERPLEDAVEQLVVRAQARAVLHARAVRDRGGQLTVRVLGHLEVEREVDRAARLEVEVEHEPAARLDPRLGARVQRRGPADPVAPHEREGARPAVRRRPVVPRNDAAQLEHGEEVGPQQHLHREPERPAVVAPHADRLVERPAGVRAPLDPQPEALGGQPLAARQLQVRVCQFMHRYGSLGVRGGQEPRQLAADADLMGA